MKTTQLITRLRKNKDKNKKNVSKKTKKKTDNQTVLVTQQQTQNNIQGLNQQSSPTTDPNKSSPKVKEATQSSPKVTQSSPKVKNDIIPEYEKKKKMSDQLVRLCNDVLVLTQMVNNANTQKGNLIKQYKTVIRGIQSTFKNINDENVYRTKDHIF